MSNHNHLRGISKEFKPILTEAIGHGWVATLTGGNHVKLTHPQHGVVFTSCTTSDWRAVHNLRHQIRRAENNPNKRKPKHAPR